MKKRYNSPVIEIIELEYSNMLALSLIDDDDRGSSRGQKGEEYRGDWENIWEGM